MKVGDEPSLDGMPRELPIFPLGGALMLPRGNLPLNIFEPRYLEMVRDAMGGDRMIGMVQPKPDGSLYEIGGVGRVTQFTDSENGTFQILLGGVSRFRILDEMNGDTPYRVAIADYGDFLDDFRQPDGLAAITRASLEEVMKTYLGAEGLSADWEAVEQADDETLVNTLASACPFDPPEKQALLEAADLPRRAATLEALMRFAGEVGETGISPSNQVH
ncbi:MAG: LON peptidase substrate-binding domain-containing protein [Pacificimonas sp.]